MIYRVNLYECNSYVGRFQNFDNQFGVTWSVYFRDQVDTVQSKVSEIILNKDHRIFQC